MRLTATRAIGAATVVLLATACSAGSPPDPQPPPASSVPVLTTTVAAPPADEPQGPPAMAAVGGGAGAAAAPEVLRHGLRILWPKPATVRIPAGSVNVPRSLPTPRWPRGRSVPRLPAPTMDEQIAAGARTASAHLSPHLATPAVLAVDDAASRWAAGVIHRAQSGAGRIARESLPHTGDARLREELHRLSLDYLSGMWCSWMQGAVLDPGDVLDKEDFVLDSEQEAVDAVWNRASDALRGRLAVASRWTSYVDSLLDLQRDIARSTTFDWNGQQWQVDPTLPMQLPGNSPFRFAVPVTQASVAHAGQLEAGLLFWYRTCYAPPRAR